MDATNSITPALGLRQREVLARLAVSRATLNRLIAEADFPPGVRLSERCRTWRADDVEAWLRRQALRGTP